MYLWDFTTDNKGAQISVPPLTQILTNDAFQDALRIAQ